MNEWMHESINQYTDIQQNHRRQTDDKRLERLILQIPVNNKSNSTCWNEAFQPDFTLKKKVKNETIQDEHSKSVQFNCPASTIEWGLVGNASRSL